jgi:hypothetical protein
MITGEELDLIEPHEASYLALAKEILEQLEKHYPNHIWRVCCQGGALIVRHDLISAYAAEKLKREGFGFTLPRTASHSRRNAVKGAIEAGGAMLELFHLPRGAWNGDAPKAPPEWLPKQQAGFA